MKRVAVISLLALGGCAVGPDFHTPPAPASQVYVRGLPASASTAAGVAQTFSVSEHATSLWWERFGSTALNKLVEHALAQSPTLLAVSARLTEAKENYRAQVGAVDYPSVDAKLSGTRQKADLGAFGLNTIPSPPPFNLYDASVSVSYTFDLFGANRRSLEALAAQVDYQSYQLRAAQLSLAGNVVTTTIRRASLQTQMALDEQLIVAQVKQLEIARQRLAAGGLSEADVRNTATTLAQTRATLAPLRTQLAQTEHQLAILTGIEPSQADFGSLSLESLTLPGNIPVEVPSALAEERPDIRASEALLHQASANVGVATANLYPQFGISASAGSERSKISDIVNGLNIWNAGLTITQPLFHGGELRAKRRAAEADYEAALGDYRQTVLQALQQVADSLQALHDDAHTLRAREEATNLEQANLLTAQWRYTAGGISESDLLDAQQQLLKSTLDRTQSRANRLADTAALFQSIGCACEPSMQHVDIAQAGDSKP